MQPDPHSAMRIALGHGPGHCPPDLFVGDVAHIIRGLKVHANNISYARHVAIEDSYPRLRTKLGEDRFHGEAARYLAQPDTLRQPLASLGRDFAELFSEPALRDLARAEQCWLDAFHAADAIALNFGDIAGLDEGALLALQICRHPAARLISLESAELFEWDCSVEGEGRALLVTRPETEVELRRTNTVDADLWQQLSRPCPFADFLGRAEGAAAASGLIAAGAIIAIPGDVA